MKRSLYSFLAIASFASAALCAAPEALALEVSSSAIEQAFAKTVTQLKRAKKVVGSELEIAGAYTVVSTNGKSRRVKKQGQDYLAATIGNFSFGDLNADGVDDLAVVVENSKGLRSVRIYIGTRGGNFALQSKSTTAVLKAKVAGFAEDPLDSISIDRHAGILKISHVGGNQQQWAIDQQFQIRDGDMMLIAQAERKFDSRSGASVSKQINFLTGETIKRSKSSSEGERKVVKTRETVRSLVKMADAAVNSKR